MDGYLKRFLAKNKYPVVMDKIEKLEAEYENLPLGDSNSNINLTLQYLGITQTENLVKAEHWGLQIEASLISLNLLVIIYLRETPYKYGEFIKKYDRLCKLYAYVDGVVVDKEFLYRYLLLLSGFVRSHLEYELSDDLSLVSGWINEEVSVGVVDKLINKWICQGRIAELYLIKWVVGGHEKVEFYLNKGEEEVGDDGEDVGDDGEEEVSREEEEKVGSDGE